MPMEAEQFQFDFQPAPQSAADPLCSWREARQREVERMCQRLGLPIGKDTEVRLKSGTTLRGSLRFAEETLLVEADRKTVILRIAEATFHISEIAAAVRTDG